jgi:hypothetical protein
MPPRVSRAAMLIGRQTRQSIVKGYHWAQGFKARVRRLVSWFLDLLDQAVAQENDVKVGGWWARERLRCGIPRASARKEHGHGI